MPTVKPVLCAHCRAKVHPLLLQHGPELFGRGSIRVLGQSGGGKELSAVGLLGHGGRGGDDDGRHGRVRRETDGLLQTRGALLCHNAATEGLVAVPQQQRADDVHAAKLEMDAAAQPQF